MPKQIKPMAIMTNGSHWSFNFDGTHMGVIRFNDASDFVTQIKRLVSDHMALESEHRVEEVRVTGSRSDTLKVVVRYTDIDDDEYIIMIDGELSAIYGGDT